MTIAELVDRERARVRASYLLAGAALAAAGTFTALALGVLALGDARWLALPRAAPLVVWLVVLAVGVLAVWWTLRRVRAEGTRARVAASIEAEQRLRAGALRGALEVADEGPLGRHAARQLATRLDGRDGGVLAPALRRRTRRLAARSGLAAVMSIAAFVALAPVFRDGLWAALAPMDAWRGRIAPPLVLRDVPAMVLRGERLRVQIGAPGRRTVTVAHRSTGEAWRTTTLAVARGTATAVLELGPLQADLALVATDGRSTSDTARVTVVDRPFLGDVAMRARFPAYLGRAPEPLPVGESARVPRGTVLEIAGRASTSLRAVRLVRGADTLALSADGYRFHGRLVAAASGRWEWGAVGAQGPIADVPPPIDLDVVPDSAPRVEIVAPGRDTVVALDDRVTLRVAATDDHGIAAVALRSWRTTARGHAQPALEQALASPDAARWSGETVLALSARGLEPGDVLHVVATATDASPWAQSGASRELVLRVPTMDERRELAREAADSAVAGASAAAAAQRRLAQRTTEAARARGERTGATSSGESAATARDRGEAMTYASAEQARALVKEQRALLDQVKALQRSAADLAAQLRQAGALDSTLAAQLQEAQNLLREALTPELAEQLRALEESLQARSAEQARDALGDLAQQQQRLREQLERSAELLRRAALEGAMQTLHDEARELAERERALADSLARPDSAGAERARALAQRSERLSEQAGALAERLAKSGGETAAPMAAAARRHAAVAAQRMADAASAAQAGRGERASAGEAQRAGREAAAAMQRAAEALGQARETQVGEWKEELSAELDRAVQEMLQLAREEQALESRARDGASGEELRPTQSAVQQGAERTAERLQQAARKSSLLSGRAQRAVGEARRAVAQATQETAGMRGRGGRTAAAMRDAAEALNRAAAALVADRERVNKASSASGFAEMMQQMQELAKQQGALNGRAAGLFGSPSAGAGMGAQQRAGARALAREQRALAERLDAVGEEAGGGRAGELAKEARQIAEALERGALDPTVLARQQRLFRRMLDAGRSLEQDERDDQGKREARAAQATEGFVPGGAASGAPATRFREPTWEELRGLSAEERRAVLDYFHRINARAP